MASGEGQKRIFTPTVLWAQRNDILYITINVEDIRHPDLKLEKDCLSFSCAAGPEEKEYAFKLEFFKDVVPEKSKYQLHKQMRNIPMVIHKADEGFWDRLVKDEKKYHWIKTDFDKWADEDDSDYESKETGFEDMMSQMSSFQAPNEEDFNEEEDSDDEDLPDLE
ncbi:prostaglandin E synthase 3-like [Tubulanus polymorphus]|uniref:prostaglandin E synthase 3-like n=1 Tax=Tubulanus polymorphus TaxID=672921 RepID=UPI003DA4AD1A